MSVDIVVVGATGQIGREVLQVLAEAGLKKDHVMAVELDRSLGLEVSYGEDAELPVKGIEQADFAKAKIVVFAVSPNVAAIHVPRAVNAGAFVIDGSGQFALEPGVPLLRPSMSRKDLDEVRKKIVAAPAPLTDLVAASLAPLHAAAKLRRVVIATYQSTSGAGKEAMDELFSQTRAVFVNDPLKKEAFSKQIAFNVIPQIDDFMADGSTEEEARLTGELRKLMGTDIGFQATCVRVPVFVGNGVSVAAEFTKPLSESAARAILKSVSDVTLFDHRMSEGYVTPAEAVGEDKVFVSRLRTDPSVESGLSYWVVGDNIRRPALNLAEAALKFLGYDLDLSVPATRH